MTQRQAIYYLLKGGNTVYSITELAKLSGVTTRTLRYYDSIDLLKPASIGENGYRFYDDKELDLLQQILFYKQFNFPLDEIKLLISTDTSQVVDSLSKHFDKLVTQKEQLETLIHSLEQTIYYYKGDINMTNEEKFTAFKQQLLQDNKEIYGEELQQNYDEETIEQYNDHWINFSGEDYAKLKKVEETLFIQLNDLEKQSITDVTHPLAKDAFLSHKEWLSLASPIYSHDYHRQMLDMYLSDERFTNYYTKHISKNSLILLKEIVYYYKLIK